MKNANTDLLRSSIRSFATRSYAIYVIRFRVSVKRSCVVDEFMMMIRDTESMQCNSMNARV